MPRTDDKNDSSGSSNADTNTTNITDTTDTNNDANNCHKHFDHTFEGWSVWLEPCPIEAEEIIREMKELSSSCGGPERGTDLFALHCTVLYNFSPRNLNREKMSMHSKKRKHVGEDHGIILSDEELGQKMLQKCIDVYCSLSSSSSSKVEGERAEEKTANDKVTVVDKGTEPPATAPIPTPINNIELNPTDFYFFPYPKEADNGRGFGCVISMLLLEKNDNLQRFHDVVADIFPPDERHGSGKSNNNSGETGDVENHDCDEDEGDDNIESSSSATTNENTSQGKTKNKFTPHMALVYAPEMYHDSLNSRTEQMKIVKKHFLNKSLKAKYLSLWSTQGSLKDWSLISKIELP